MARQRVLLHQHQSTLQRIYDSKFQQDFFVDVGSLMASLWVTRSVLIRYPIAGLSQALGYFPFSAMYRLAAMTGEKSAAEIAKVLLVMGRV